jgi:hypothetical protein
MPDSAKRLATTSPPGRRTRGDGHAEPPRSGLLPALPMTARADPSRATEDPAATGIPLAIGARVAGGGRANPAGRRALSQAALLALQRSAGNRAVARYLAGRAVRPTLARDDTTKRGQAPALGGTTDVLPIEGDARIRLSEAMTFPLGPRRTSPGQSRRSPTATAASRSSRPARTPTPA